VILSAHQPAYLPWLGYFDKILRSDIFVYLDSVQFEKGSFINRNKIKTANGPTMLTIPLKLQGYKEVGIGDIQVDNSQNWQHKHLKSISLSYRKATRFEECFSKLEKLYKDKSDLLSDICLTQLRFWLQEFSINTKVVCSRGLPVKSKKSDLVFDLCRHFIANDYLSGPLGKHYLKESDFFANDIKVTYQDYKHPVYPQLYGDFLPSMGIIDFYMNSGDLSILKTKGPVS
jgi:hypothetical protein